LLVKTNLARAPSPRLMMEGLVFPSGSLEVVQVKLSFDRVASVFLEAWKHLR
jgi:hypothetical protein